MHKSALRSLVVNVERYIDDCLPTYIEELRTVCAIDSGSEYKSGLDEMARWLSIRMKKLGMQVTLMEHDAWGNDVLGELRGDGEPLVLLGHTDTVYPTGTAAARPLRREGNVLSAPGASDMKGCILSALYAIEALLALGYSSYGEIRLLCVSDEEISQRHSVDLIRQVCQNSCAVLVLEAARSNGDIVSARKGTAWYTLTAQGRSAHAGVEPEKGRNALIELAHQILQFQSLNQWLEGLSICPGVMHSGTLPNVVPELATARLDLRFLRPSDREATEKRWGDMLRQHYVPGVELTLEREAYRDPMVSTLESLQLVSHAQEIAGMLGFSLDHVLAGGTSDGQYAAELGIPVLDGLGPIGGLDHSPDEYMLVESIAPRIALLAGLIATIGK